MLQGNNFMKRFQLDFLQRRDASGVVKKLGPYFIFRQKDGEACEEVMRGHA